MEEVEAAVCGERTAGGCGSTALDRAGTIAGYPLPEKGLAGSCLLQLTHISCRDAVEQRCPTTLSILPATQSILRASYWIELSTVAKVIIDYFDGLRDNWYHRAEAWCVGSKCGVREKI